MRYLVLAFMVLGLAACSRDADNGSLGGGSADTQRQQDVQPPPPQRHASLAPTKGNEAKGDLTLTQRDGAVEISGQLTGLKPNTEHGFHIHENGDCSAPDASSAGAHFNPTNQPHGKPGSGAHHEGDMQAVRSDDSGVASVDVRAIGATLGDGSPADVVGKAIVLHEKPDDYTTQPSGDSGDRIACGVIQ